MCLVYAASVVIVLSRVGVRAWVLCLHACLPHAGVSIDFALKCLCDISPCVSDDFLRKGLRTAQHSWTSKAGRPLGTSPMSLFLFVFMSATQTHTP